MDELYLQVTSGRGPVECCRVVVMVVGEMLADASRQGLDAEVFDYNGGRDNDTWSSAIVRICGGFAKKFADEWCGTIQWVAQSVYRPNHGRKNWFVGVSLIEMSQKLCLNDDEIKYDTFRASGPGGQHVNKTESAVRAIHVPSGLSVTASDHRSQMQNRKLARERLLMKIALLQQSQNSKNEYRNWNNHNMLRRGNPVKVFKKPMK